MNIPIVSVQTFRGIATGFDVSSIAYIPSTGESLASVVLRDADGKPVDSVEVRATKIQTDAWEHEDEPFFKQLAKNAGFFPSA